MFIIFYFCLNEMENMRTVKMFAMLHPAPFNKKTIYIFENSKSFKENIGNHLQLHLYACIAPKNDFHHWRFHNFIRKLRRVQLL